jgi:hypothetical protein
MKNQITVSKKDLIRKGKAKHSADLHIALQLYAFYKAETIKRSLVFPEMIPEDLCLRQSIAYPYCII